MLIHKKSKKIILHLADPSKVLNVIPTARAFVYKGRTLVAVPAMPDEVKVLNNLGLDVPNPILHFYDWPMANPDHKPFDAQLHTSDFLTTHSRAFCLNDMGTGKTLSTLWSFDFLKQCGLLDKALVITPLSTLERTWGDEIFRNFPHLNFSVLHGTRDKRLKLLNQDADIYLINHDGVKVNGFVEALADRPDIDLIVTDEIASFRNQGTARWKALNAIVNKQCDRRAWGLTGTPTPNAPTDAWAQCRIIVPHKVPQYYGRFRDTVMKQVTQFKWIPRENATSVVHEAMQPSIRYRRDECVDLPPVMYETRHAEMTDTQKKAYKLMLTKLAFEANQGQVLAVNEAVKASKLVQIACGAAYDTDGGTVHLDVSTRIEVVKEIIDEAGSKVLVFVPFTAALHHVAEAIAMHLAPAGATRDKMLSNGHFGDQVAVVEGATKKADRDAIFTAFQKGDELRVIVANPGTLSHGLTLTAASTIIWFAPSNSNEQYEQANARITRPGQKLNQFIVHIEGSEIERRMYERLKTKQSMQNVLLEMLKEGR